MNRKEAIRDYKLSHRPMGVFQIRNTTNNKLLISSSLNIPGRINRHKFALNAGTHPSRSLQADWKECGESSFVFETLEEIVPREAAGYDYAADLETLEDLWLEKLEPYGEKGYNERKMTSEQRLRMIAANRKL